MYWLKSFTIACAVGTLTGTSAWADWVELKNQDRIQGEILSLDQKELRLKSENFGEMTIPRDKISIMGLGDAPPPQAQAAPAASAPQGQLSREIPSLENPQMQRMMRDILGRGGLQDLSKQIQQSQQGLKDLRKDMDGASGEALDGYIQMFDLFNKIAPRVETPPNRRPPARNRRETEKPNTPNQSPANKADQQKDSNRE